MKADQMIVAAMAVPDASVGRFAVRFVVPAARPRIRITAVDR